MEEGRTNKMDAGLRATEEPAAVTALGVAARGEASEGSVALVLTADVDDSA
jgi:hypothetical protein